jgi:hypothetical protein
LHYHNKSENWVTQGIRAEVSGSYMIKRVSVKGLKMLEILLRAEGYMMVEADRAALNDYFIRGDERLLPVEAPVVETEATTLNQ